MRMKALALSALMVVASGTAYKLTPQPLYDKDYRPPVTLENLVPTRFGDWYVDPASNNQVVNPSVAKHVATIYTDVLSRTYINPAGDRVMLSLAYGADQGRASQVHKPEVCYATQGFQLKDAEKASFNVHGIGVPVMHLVASLGPRQEPLSYWIRTGDYLVRGWLEQNSARVKNGFLKGYTPDGILVRVSTIDSSPARAYGVQARFIQDLMNGSSHEARLMLWGAQLEDQYLAKR